jgi:hypothetical protein
VVLSKLVGHLRVPIELSHHPFAFRAELLHGPIEFRHRPFAFWTLVERFADRIASELDDGEPNGSPLEH